MRIIPHVYRFSRMRYLRGQSMVEYLIALTIVVALIAVPIDDSNSVIELLLKAIRIAYHRFLAAISLPM
jgi:hypothetical protein